MAIRIRNYAQGDAKDNKNTRIERGQPELLAKDSTHLRTSPKTMSIYHPFIIHIFSIYHPYIIHLSISSQHRGFGGAVPRACLSGFDWVNAADALKPVGEVWVQLFHIYVAFCSDLGNGWGAWEDGRMGGRFEEPIVI